MSLPEQNEWVRHVTFGHGSPGLQCALCGASDYHRGGHVDHEPDCPAERYPTKTALFVAINRNREALVLILDVLNHEADDGTQLMQIAAILEDAIPEVVFGDGSDE